MDGWFVGWTMRFCTLISSAHCRASAANWDLQLVLIIRSFFSLFFFGLLCASWKRATRKIFNQEFNETPINGLFSNVSHINCDEVVNGVQNNTTLSSQWVRRKKNTHRKLTSPMKIVHTIPKRISFTSESSNLFGWADCSSISKGTEPLLWNLWINVTLKKGLTPKYATWIWKWCDFENVKPHSNPHTVPNDYFLLYTLPFRSFQYI